MFGDDPEWDLAILSYIHDHIIDASGGLKGFHDEGLTLLGPTKLNIYKISRSNWRFLFAI